MPSRLQLRAPCAAFTLYYQRGRRDACHSQNRRGDHSNPESRHERLCHRTLHARRRLAAHTLRNLCCAQVHFLSLQLLARLRRQIEARGLRVEGG